MMSNVDPDDSVDLFRKATRDVKPLPVKKIAYEKPKPKPRALFTRADNHAVLRESLGPIADPALVESGDEISFRRPGIPETLLRKLRRGHFSVDAELDLHGLTSPQARNALRECA
jgi:DNA-nicking Smr family endonuclease